MFSSEFYNLPITPLVSAISLTSSDRHSELALQAKAIRILLCVLHMATSTSHPGSPVETCTLWAESLSPGSGKLLFQRVEVALNVPTLEEDLVVAKGWLSMTLVSDRFT